MPGILQLVEGEQQQNPQKHGQNNTDSEHEADYMSFIERLLCACVGRSPVFWFWKLPLTKVFYYLFYQLLSGQAKTLASTIIMVLWRNKKPQWQEMPENKASYDRLSEVLGNSDLTADSAVL